MADEFDQALAKSLRLLAVRERFESELRSRLGGFSEDTVERVIAQLKIRKLLSERRAVNEFAHAKSGKKALSQEAIRAELSVRGASSESVRNLSLKPDLDLAVDLLQSKFSIGSFDRAKAGRTLHRRGFAEEDIEMALDRFTEMEGER